MALGNLLVVKLLAFRDDIKSDIKTLSPFVSPLLNEIAHLIPALWEASRQWICHFREKKRWWGLILLALCHQARGPHNSTPHQSPSYQLHHSEASKGLLNATVFFVSLKVLWRPFTNNFNNRLCLFLHNCTLDCHAVRHGFKVSFLISYSYSSWDLIKCEVHSWEGRWICFIYSDSMLWATRNSFDYFISS